MDKMKGENVIAEINIISAVSSRAWSILEVHKTATSDTISVHLGPKSIALRAYTALDKAHTILLQWFSRSKFLKDALKQHLSI